MWTNTFQEGLKIVGENISLSLPDGRQELFRLTDGAISSDATTGTLSKDQAGWRYDYRDGTSSLFDVQGRLIQRKVRGQVITITYPNLSTTKAKDGFGNTLTVSWNATKQPYLVDYNGSLKVEYLYDGGARLVSKKTTSQGLNRTRKYLYADSGNAGLMVGIIDEQGTRYATWTYDNQGRAISSEHANGAEKVSLAYNDDGSTTVTNEYGKQATYRFQVIQGIKRIVAIEGQPSPNCPSSNSTFTYDDQGLLTSKRDNNGNLTTYQYNARGLETSRTEAAGTAQARTITTDWHPTLFLPVQVSEPGRITRYQYDAEGRRTSEGIMTNQ
ncbi:RHS repeat protein [Pseudomonas aeruginosa]|nr:RHS repeat protein [Pseudomonas aeruginosa]